MKRTKINAIPENLPGEILDFILGADIYDSSSSPEARVYFIDKGCGYYLKISDAGTLEREALMTDYFYKRGLSARVARYLSQKRDYLVTEKISGEDLTHAEYISDPKRLCILLATKMRELHEMDFFDCPVRDRVSEYLALADKNYRLGSYDKSAFPNSFGYRCEEDAYRALMAGRVNLKNEVLIHGDFCLPNVLFDGGELSGFVDLGNSGVGDRHIDIFWGVWTLWFNLGTDEYTDLFFDTYGRDKIDMEKLKTVAAAEVFG